MNINYRNISNHTNAINEQYQENKSEQQGVEKVNNMDAIYIDPKIISKVNLESNTLYKKMQEFDYTHLQDLEGDFAQIQSSAVSQQKVVQLLSSEK